MNPANIPRNVILTYAGIQKTLDTGSVILGLIRNRPPELDSGSR